MSGKSKLQLRDVGKWGYKVVTFLDLGFTGILGNLSKFLRNAVENATYLLSSFVHVDILGDVDAALEKRTIVCDDAVQISHNDIYTPRLNLLQVLNSDIVVA